ncbi:hypothetical protein WJX77_003771 [Trebouxia sp. C0004]
MSLAMHNAAREGNVAELTKLLAQGSSASTRDKHSRQPLHLSAWAGQLECCKVLIAEGADKGAAAMDDTTALHFAAQKGHAEIARFLLNEGASVNGKTRKGMTALMFASQSGNAELVKLLIKRKADPASKNKNGKSAADLAREQSIKELLQIAAVTAQQQKADTARPDENTAQTALDLSAATDANEPTNEQVSSVAEIGPQEQPTTSMSQGTGNTAPVDSSKQSNVVQKRPSPDDAVHDQSDDQQQIERPAKFHKIALSFADDEDDEL